MKEENDEKTEFCSCEEIKEIHPEYDAWGYWYVYNECGKKIEDEYHYYNHYDGEDHDDIDLYN